MKTKVSFWKKNILLLIVLVAVSMLFFSYGNDFNQTTKEYSKDDSVSFKSFTGKIVDLTGKPVVFANVFISGSGIGTVTNLDGEFIIKVPKNYLEKDLEISFLGFKNQKIPITNLKLLGNTINIQPSTINIEEVIIRSHNPVDLITGAAKRIPENYSVISEMQKGFYRETVKKSKNYVAISEAVVDIYKSPYNSDFIYDQVKVYKGRKSQDVKKMDTINFKLQGGPSSTILLDVVKNPSTLLNTDLFSYYDYELVGIVEVDNNKAYAINFEQKKKYDFPMYSGKIYLDADNLAISQIEFSLNELSLDVAAKMLVRKSPIAIKVKPLTGSYLANYRKINGKWHLNYVRAEVKFKCNWKKKLFNSIYTAMTEMAITDIDTINISKFKNKEVVKMSDIFVDKVNHFEDENYWGEYNYIKPDESIEIAISKLGKKLLH